MQLFSGLKKANATHTLGAKGTKSMEGVGVTFKSGKSMPGLQ